MLRIVLTVGLTIVISSQLCAEPIPLLEVYRRSGNLVFNAPVATMRLEASLRTPGPEIFDWTETYGPEDAGTSDWADVTILDGAREALARRGDVTYIISNVLGDIGTVILFDQQGNQVGPPNFPCQPDLSSSTCLTFHVTDMRAYNLVALERVVHEVSISPNHPPDGPWVVNAAHTIRYWGEPVPEPGTLLLSLFVVHSLGIIRVRL
jgi:hypothetical protein